MKRIAIFVEGQTEQFFINRLLKEIAGNKNISITLSQLRGGTNIPKQEVFIPSMELPPTNPKYEALIYDCGNDDKVKSDILDNIANLAIQGYSEIIGIRDLYPLSLVDLSKLEAGLKFVPPSYNPLPIPFKIIVAVHEVEAWFLAESNHYPAIDIRLSTAIISANLGFNPELDDMTLQITPALDLNNAYQIVGRAYKKTRKHVERTVECLDYHNLYFNLSLKIEKLNDLISKINSFLT